MLKHMKVTNLPGHDSWVLLLLLGLACLFFAPLVAPWVTVWPEWSWPCWGWNRALMASEAKNTAAPIISSPRSVWR